MKVMLVDPPTSHEQIYGDWDLSKLDTYCPPLGLLYIAAFLRANSHTPFIVDVAARNWSITKTVEYIIDTDPAVVGITAKTINILNAVKISEALRERGYLRSIVLGGAHVTAVPEETLKLFNCFDYGVVGEGEITFLELLENIDSLEAIRGIKGIAWKDNHGDVHVNERRTFIDDLDSLPLPAWDLLPNFPHAYKHSALETKRLPAASIMTSRGCPFQCTFCDRAIFGCSVRQHSAEYTLKMIRYLKNNYGIKDLMMLDDNFILNKDKLFKICSAIINENLDLSWYCMGHAKFMTKDRLQMIKDAGCWIVEIGIESGSERILKSIKKGTSKNEIFDAVQRAREIGLKVKGNFIFGFPSETKERLQETNHFVSKLNLTNFQQNYLTVWPGCEISKYAHDFGKVETDLGKLAHQRVTYVPDGLTEADLVQASKRAFRRFYLTPRVIIDILSTLTSLRSLKNLFVSFMVFVKTILRNKNKKNLTLKN